MALRQLFHRTGFYPNSFALKKPGADSTDIFVTDQGAIWTFYPRSTAAQTWWVGHVHTENWQRVGRCWAVDHRRAHDLLEALEQDGFVIDGGRDD